ncbi:ABC transporter ATP-binding protein [Sporichthya polymorpha]|uniref:ABC transporter ATP-binding protein n=1 Tax=Sporichthya polymorpha TaxID=35751 RepID=UPI00037332F5|nr:ABC transporter ATP-binding protein [Sporichthya polymorpha]
MTERAEPRLSLRGLRSGYDRVPVVFDVGLDVNPGEIVILVGGNGAGKSTLLQTVMGTVAVLGGDVRYDGRSIARWPVARRTRAGISYSPEGRRVFPTLTVRENLDAGASHVPTRRLPERRAEVFSYFPTLADRSAQIAGTLSGGEQQMLAIGRALMTDPALILVEEPSQGLAPVIVDRVYATLQKICLDRGTSVVIAEQFQQLRAHDCDRVFVIDKGEVRPYTAAPAAEPT